MKTCEFFEGCKLDDMPIAEQCQLCYQCGYSANDRTARPLGSISHGFLKDINQQIKSLNEVVATKIQNIVAMPIVNDMSSNNIGNILSEMLSSGWVIVPCSCTCGGRWALMKPHESGAQEMFGCICHHLDKAISEFSLS